MFTRKASARYEGFGKEGKGHLSTESGVLDDVPYSFSTRFGDERGTNPEELIAAAHAGCFTMALSFALAKEGFSAGSLATEARVTVEQGPEGFTVTRSDLLVEGKVEGISAEQFAEIAESAKANCPISRLLKAEISLDQKLQ